MRTLSPISKRKNAVSTIIAYVLLISITLSLSVLVYNWLRYYADSYDDSLPECPDGTNIVIQSYECAENVYINFTLKNKGRFTTDGFILRFHDRDDAEFGIYTVNSTGVSLAPGESVSVRYELGVSPLGEYSESMDKISLIDVQPFMLDDGKVSCQTRAIQRNVVC